jgi:hypothetical protein
VDALPDQKPLAHCVHERFPDRAIILVVSFRYFSLSCNSFPASSALYRTSFAEFAMATGIAYYPGYDLKCLLETWRARSEKHCFSSPILCMAVVFVQLGKSRAFLSRVMYGASTSSGEQIPASSRGIAPYIT